MMVDAALIRDEVRQVYTTIAERPEDKPRFPTGLTLAIELGYPPHLLETLPPISVEAFCGISNVSLFADIQEGTTVLDLGCGAGLDTLIAARRTGKRGKVIAIDFSKAMLARTRQAIVEYESTNVETYLADAEKLPVDAESIDAVIINGIFNLNPNRERLFSELARILRSNGAVYAAELILTAPLSAEDRISSENWFN